MSIQVVQIKNLTKSTLVVSSGLRSLPAIGAGDTIEAIIGGPDFPKDVLDSLESKNLIKVTEADSEKGLSKLMVSGGVITDSDKVTYLPENTPDLEAVTGYLGKPRSAVFNDLTGEPHKEDSSKEEVSEEKPKAPAKQKTNRSKNQKKVSTASQVEVATDTQTTQKLPE